MYRQNRRKKKRSLASPLEQDEDLSAVAKVSDNISTSRRKLSHIRMKYYFSATTFHLQECMKIFGFGEFVFKMLKCLPTLSNDAQVSGCQWI